VAGNTTSRDGSPEDSQIESLKALIQYSQELDDRDTALEIEEIRLRRSAGQLDNVEATLNEQKILASAADRLVARENFKERFCSLYVEQEPLATTVETVAELAEKVCEVINELYPTFMGYIAVATLSAVVILKRGVDLYCSAAIKGDQPKAGATI
jgi:hypothetical protein